MELLNIYETLYKHFGAFSNQAYEILKYSVRSSNYNLHEISRHTGIGFRTVRDVINLFFNDIIVSNDILTISKRLENIFLNDLDMDIENDLTNTELKMQEIISGFSFHNKNLDHISAIPLTCCKRAEYISNKYDVSHCNLLFLGDHDFTSIAVAMLSKSRNINYKITVIDIDNNVLSYIDSIREKYKLQIRLIYSDFRFNIPTNLCDSFDVVFTDPPYTPNGMGVFLNKAIQLVKDNPFSTIHICYKAAEQSNKLGWLVQNEISKRKLYLKEILNNYNIYYDAEAIGYRSNLYTCNLTPDSKKVIENFGTEINIYTHGNSSVESQAKNTIFMEDFMQGYNYIKDQLKITDLFYIGNISFNNNNKLKLNQFISQKESGIFHILNNKEYLIDVTDLKDSIELRILLWCNFQKFYLRCNRNLLDNEESNYFIRFIRTLFCFREIKSFDKTVLYEVKIDTRSISGELLSNCIGNRGSVKNLLVKTISNKYNYTKNQVRNIIDAFNIIELADSALFYLPDSLIKKLINHLNEVKIN